MSQRDARTFTAAAQGRVRVWDRDDQDCVWESPPTAVSIDSHVTALSLGHQPSRYVVFGTSDGIVTCSHLDRTVPVVNTPGQGGVTSVVTGTSDAGQPFFAAGGGPEDRPSGTPALDACFSTSTRVTVGFTVWPRYGRHTAGLLRRRSSPPSRDSYSGCGTPIPAA